MEKAISMEKISPRRDEGKVAEMAGLLKLVSVRSRDAEGFGAAQASLELPFLPRLCARPSEPASCG